MTTKTVPSDQRIRVYLQDSTGAVQREARLAANVRLESLTPAIVRALSLPEDDGQGRALRYFVFHQDRAIDGSLSLSEAGVTDGATLTLAGEPVESASAPPPPSAKSAFSEEDWQRISEIVRLALQDAKTVDLAPASVAPAPVDGRIIPARPIWGEPNKADMFKCDVFMIMPIGRRELEPVWKIIRQAVEGMNLIIKRGDDIRGAGDIMDEVWAAIYNARLVIGECTKVPNEPGGSPEVNGNVYYELGIAHMLGKQAVLVVQSSNHIPFDLRSIRHTTYAVTTNGEVTWESGQSLMSEIKKFVQAIIDVNQA
jgi:hypothetical protein